MLVAQAPGEKEDAEGEMFIGPSGKVLDELLKSAGVARSEIYMTNLVKCFLPGYRKPKHDEIKTCSRYLEREIEIVNPEIIAPLGFFATRHILGKYAVAIPAKSEFGRLYGNLMLVGEKKILPLRHPAALLYKEDVRAEMTVNYRKLKALLAHCKWYPVCPMKHYFEMGRLDRKWVDLYCKGDWRSCIRYQMEERGQAHPDWMLPDGSIEERLGNCGGGY